MPYITTPDQVRLYYEEAGHGEPILFLHEFAGDHRSWEPQMRAFARANRCIVYAARGYPPSDVPTDPTVYSYQHVMRDAVALLDALEIERAHLVGLSMGGYSALQVGLNHPERVLSLTLAGTGSGSERWYTDEFRRQSLALADQFEADGSPAVAAVYGHGPARVPFALKDPRGFDSFLAMFAGHDRAGSAHTMRGYQAARPSLYDFIEPLQGLDLPTLIVVGDEDDPCVEPSLFLKHVIRAAGLVVLPKTGHVVNLEEPDRFNLVLADFLTRVSAGTWVSRDPRSVRPRG